MTLAARKPDPYAAIRCDVIGMTGALIRLAAPGRADLFDDPFAGFAVGDVVLLDSGVYGDGPDDAMGCAGEVIGLPRPGVVEVRANCAFPSGTRRIAVSKSRIAPRREVGEFFERMAKGAE